MMPPAPGWLGYFIDGGDDLRRLTLEFDVQPNVTPRVRALRSALAHLSPLHRRVITMRNNHDLPFETIAKLLKSEGFGRFHAAATVRALYQQAVRHLRKRMGR